jgi:hypothetical protein
VFACHRYPSHSIVDRHHESCIQAIEHQWLGRGRNIAPTPHHLPYTHTTSVVISFARRAIIPAMFEHITPAMLARMQELEAQDLRDSEPGK